jgi:hypothetical protein
MAPHLHGGRTSRDVVERSMFVTNIIVVKLVELAEDGSGRRRMRGTCPSGNRKVDF